VEILTGKKSTSYPKGKPKKNTRSLWYRIKRDKLALIMLSPTIILLFIFSYIPIYGVLIGFQDYKIGQSILSFGGGTKWVGLEHFLRFIQSIFFSRIFGNTLRLSILNLVFGFWVPIVFSLLLNEIRIRSYKKVVQTFVYLPYFISAVIVVAMLNNIVSADGVVNKLINLLGGESIGFMNNPEYFDLLYVTSNIWQSFGYNSIIYLASISSIDPNLYSAAEVDGANRIQKMRYVTLPGMASTIVILLIFAVGGVLNSNTEKILLMYNPTLYEKADVIGTYVYRSGLVNAQYSYTTAVGLFTNIINFILVFTTNSISRKLTDYGLW
jgi:putative aldouronate transport system permease protein